MPEVKRLNQLKNNMTLTDLINFSKWQLSGMEKWYGEYIKAKSVTREAAEYRYKCQKKIIKILMELQQAENNENNHSRAGR
jgi:hypothetical protein